MNTPLHLAIGLIVASVVGPPTFWAMEPFPFSDITITTASTEGDTTHAKVPVAVSMFGQEECPYLIETKVFDSDGATVVDQKQEYLVQERGSISQGQQVPVQSPAEPGRGLLKARVGAMCNIAQWVWPRYSDWIEVQINFTGER